MSQIDFAITRGDDECLDIVVDYYAVPEEKPSWGYAGGCDGHPAHLVINAVTLKDGTELELTAQEVKSLERDIAEYINERNQYDDESEDYDE